MKIQAVSRRSFNEVADNESFHPSLPGLVEKVEEWCGEGGEVTVFDALWAPEMSVNDFLVRICKYAKCSPGVFVAMEVYLERVKEVLPVTPLNVHRIVLAALMVAAKYVDDTRVSLQHYANLAGISLAEVNQIEAAFLLLLDWDLSIPSYVVESDASGSESSTPTTPYL
eukprot:TRINITY_DN981_c0_g1_i1.p1 TRINITY_DN981_c0_g1~~TRINITY_DN981_c0_g1_i1.p1  ORF type:complete len:169 (+),score=26.58 TRINITY_DN981_c0_g1_i1:58-564(+)